MKFDGFDWDKGNRTKCQEHGVSIKAIESLFLNYAEIFPDKAHSQTERRFRAVGKTIDGRSVLVAFTVRRDGEDILVRPSARYMHIREVKVYEKENPDLQDR